MTLLCVTLAILDPNSNEVKLVNSLASKKLFIYIGINDVLLDPIFDIMRIGPKLDSVTN